MKDTEIAANRHREKESEIEKVMGREVAFIQANLARQELEW